MCALPNQGVAQLGGGAVARGLVDQVSDALKTISDATVLAIYVDGSFFSDAEVPKSARQGIYQLLRDSAIEVLIVESLSEFVNEHELRDFGRVLPNVKLVVGMGIQSVDSVIRNLCVNSTETADGFERAHSQIMRAGYLTKAYVMLKPPFVSNREAIDDCVESCLWLSEKGVTDIAICPTRVVAGTIAQDLFDRGLFQPPRLDAIGRVLGLLHARGVVVRVSLINIKSDDLRSIVPHGCDACGEALSAALAGYNAQPQDADFSLMRCGACESEQDRDDELGLSHSAAERVSAYLQLLKNCSQGSVEHQTHGR
jgi:radical SAM enzyme (TIGR01210 family)